MIANNYIINVTLPFYQLTEEEINKLPTVCINGKKLDSKFRLASSPDEDISKNLLKENKFEAIVNACDPDEEVNLQFDYMVDSLGLNKYRIINLSIFDLSKESLKKTLKDFSY